ncbi:MAG: pyrroline-5-carboxylate reductase [Phycisphaerae bacterium]
MADVQLGVIGAGNMAEAMVRGAISAGVLQSGEIIAADPDESRRRLFAEELGVEATAENAAAAGAPRVLLAVKPQQVSGVLQSIAAHVREDATVISIAAGVSTSAIDAALGGKGRIVRVMPNTPMLAGAGMSALAAGPRATEYDLDWTRRLLEAAGKAVTVSEEMMDAVTAVSGSGPAYFFYLIEAMVAAGVAEGLQEQTAALLARQTCLGAAKLLEETGESPETLRARVTSPGGTTQKAIETLDAAGVRDSLIAAVRAAAARSRELGG